ncbi:MAG: nucleotidyltransferase family protein [Chloroflexi bacterium]|nr:nucleotidyltransferase family protein [Chloroflexota bacterium]
MTRIQINLPQDRIADFCRRNHIRKFSLFGSVVREDFRPDSDVDVLVEFEPEYVPGLSFFAMQLELSQILGRAVDLNTPQWLSPRFRDDVQREQVAVYV